MKKVAYKSKRKKKKLLFGDYIDNTPAIEPEIEGENFLEQNIDMFGTAASALTIAGGAMQANSEKPDMTGAVLKGGGMGAKVGGSIVPGWGHVIGGLAGAGIAAARNNNETNKWNQEQDEMYKGLETKAIYASAANLGPDQRGIGKGSSFKEGGVILEPDFTTQLADGGYLKPISDTTTEVIGDNPNVTDGVELENAFVNDGETIEKVNLEQGGEVEAERVYTDAYGRNGKKATKKNPSYSKEQKALQVQKTGEKKYEEFVSGKCGKLIE